MDTLDALAVRPEALGSAAFRRDHSVRLAYVAGSMYKGVASEEMVLRMGRSRLLAFFGTGGLPPRRVEAAVEQFARRLGPDLPYGANLLAVVDRPRAEDEMVEILLRHRVPRIEAASFVTVSKGLARYRASGLRRARDGGVAVAHRVLAKVSRPDVAVAFLQPAPPDLLAALREERRITAEEAELARMVPVADDVCAEADSGGHTDQRPLVTLLPELCRLRDRTGQDFPPTAAVRVGVAGGLGSPEAIAAAFVLGADFVLTGSVNQCTVEAGTSDTAKDLLQQAEAHDTAIVPAGDMFEIGAKTQVLKRGLFFPARAVKLHELYRRHDSLDDLDPQTAEQLQRRVFRRSFAEVWAETREHYRRTAPEQVERADREPKHKMALVFRWYFVHSTRLALSGSPDQRVDYQIACGPAMGALNGLLRGTPREDWRRRHVDDLADLLMAGAAEVLDRRVRTLLNGTAAQPPAGAAAL
jgi:trans-AT polyketide synthase/acyltransferase/oxidoreductase domain-containing protein